MNNEKNRGLREGAMMVALTVILILLTWYVPFFSVVGTFACAVPIACLAARNNVKTVAVALVSVLIITVLTIGSLLSAISMCFMSVLPGAVAGFYLGKRSPFFTTLIATCVAVCIGWVLEIFLVDVFLPGNGINGVLGEITGSFNEIVSSFTNRITTEEMNGIDIEKITKNLTQTMEHTFRLYFPSMVIVSSMVIGYIIVMLCSFVLRRTKIKDVKTVPFSSLKAPRSMSTVAVISYLVIMLTGVESTLGAVLANVVFVLYTIIGVCGLSLCDYKIRKKIKSAVVRIIIYFLIFLFGGFFLNFILNGLVIAGILDSTYNFRRIDSESECV